MKIVLKQKEGKGERGREKKKKKRGKLAPTSLVEWEKKGGRGKKTKHNFHRRFGEGKEGKVEKNRTI